MQPTRTSQRVCVGRERQARQFASARHRFRPLTGSHRPLESGLEYERAASVVPLQPSAGPRRPIQRLLSAQPSNPVLDALLFLVVALFADTLLPRTRVREQR